jgi:putative transposase
MSKKRDWDKVGEIVSKIEELGLSFKEGAIKYGIKVGLLYEYNKRKNRLEGKDTPSDSESESCNAKKGLPRELEELITEYRRENPDHGFKRIQEKLKSKHLVVVTRKQIRRVLKHHGLLGDLDSSFDRKKEPAKGTRRFEADYPRQLYQMDVTYVYITGIPVLYLVVVIDDYSRFCVAADLCVNQRGTTLLGVLHNACLQYGNPEKLLTDQGSGFYTWSMERTLFQKYLDDMRVEHIVAEPHSPQTSGKVERLIQTIKKELLEKIRFSSYEEAKGGIFNYIKSYNYERVHQGIAGARPSDRFHGVIGEVSRMESQLCGKDIDLSKGYLVYKVQDHTLSVVTSGEGIEVYLDGKLLKEDAVHGSKC